MSCLSFLFHLYHLKSFNFSFIIDTSNGARHTSNHKIRHTHTTVLNLNTLLISARMFLFYTRGRGHGQRSIFFFLFRRVFFLLFFRFFLFLLLLFFFLFLVIPISPVLLVFYFLHLYCFPLALIRFFLPKLLTNLRVVSLLQNPEYVFSITKLGEIRCILLKQLHQFLSLLAFRNLQQRLHHVIPILILHHVENWGNSGTLLH